MRTETYMLRSIQIYQIIRFSSTLLIFWTFSRVFSTTQVGVIEKNLLIANVSTFFWLQAIQTHFLKKQTYTYNEYASFILLVSACVSTPLLIYSSWHKVYLFSGLYVLFYPFGTLIEMYLIAQKQNKSLIYYSSIFYGMWLILMIVATLLYRSLCVTYGVWIAILFFRSLFCIIYIPLRLRSINLDFLSNLSWLMLTFAIGGGAEYIDGFLIDFLFDKGTLAQFRYGARELPVFVVLANGVSLWATQQVAHSTNTTLEQVLLTIKQKSTKYLLLNTLLSVMLICISRPLYMYVYGKDYLPSSVVFDITLVIVVSRFTFPNSILLGLNLDKVQFIITCIELILNFILSVILVQFWGMYGVAIATVVAYLIEKVLLAAYMHQRTGVAFYKYISLSTVLLSYVVVVGTLIVKYTLF
ncbi:MAG: polysaccharide biosynthesis C-terminal domain-containing protein [Bacteroidia bacterium]|nr:polysaccharide biosynthesis C-terminal domain-containing protein [Bacteroidia bacterium]MDW8345761.1 polysaccharide biosynthesis C-terminal domain-containing protein [Bacteroidia bacterium]